jgi:hypothetical protein
MDLGKYKLVSYTNSMGTVDGEPKEVRTMNFSPVSTSGSTAPMGMMSPGISVVVTDEALWPQFSVDSEYEMSMTPPTSGATATKKTRAAS